MLIYSFSLYLGLTRIATPHKASPETPPHRMYLYDEINRHPADERIVQFCDRGSHSAVSSTAILRRAAALT